MLSADTTPFTAPSCTTLPKTATTSALAMKHIHTPLIEITMLSYRQYTGRLEFTMINTDAYLFPNTSVRHTTKYYVDEKIELLYDFCVLHSVIYDDKPIKVLLAQKGVCA
jgi:hypothetical protein